MRENGILWFCETAWAWSFRFFSVFLLRLNILLQSLFSNHLLSYMDYVPCSVARPTPVNSSVFAFICNGFQAITQSLFQNGAKVSWKHMRLSFNSNNYFQSLIFLKCLFRALFCEWVKWWKWMCSLINKLPDLSNSFIWHKLIEELSRVFLCLCNFFLSYLLYRTRTSQICPKSHIF